MTDSRVPQIHHTRDLLAHLFAGDLSHDKPFTEALFTTFNVDLGFFETRVLGLVRSTGAAVTVVADAGVWAPDPRSIKGAGAAYTVGLVDMPRAFHPKVAVLAGPERGLVAVGSGNLTTGGWLSNAETVTIAHGNLTDGVPALFEQVATWLRSLTALRTGELALDAIGRAATALEYLTERATPVDGGPTLVTTSAGPILEQLPKGDVDELRLHAPFHDAAGTALTALIDRYRPRLVRIAVQPGMTVLEPAALEEVAAAAATKLVWQDAGTPYRHGKLIEAHASLTRWSLTGSANLTDAALLRGLDAGGNCEVGLVHHGGPGLYPGTGPTMASASIPANRIQSAPGEVDAPSARAPRLLSASIGATGLRLELADHAPIPLDVEASDFLQLPEEFAAIGSVPVGARETVVTLPDSLHARGRVRLAWTVNGVRTWSPLVFVTDPSATLHRVAAPSSARTNVDVDVVELFGSAALQADWFRQLDTVMREQAVTVPLPRASTPRIGADSGLGTVSSWQTVDDPDAWVRYSQDAVDRLGPTIAHQASGGTVLPQLGRIAATASAPIWEDVLDPSEADFDDERSADEQDSETEEPEEPTPIELAETDRARTRRWLHRIVDQLDERPAIDRCALTHVVLIGTYMDLWAGDDDERWFDLLATAVRQLPGHDVPSPLEAHVGSLAALCLYRLDQAAGLDRRTGTGLAYRQTSASLRDALSAAEPSSLTALLEQMFGGATLAPTTEAVMDHATAALDANPWPEATRLLQLEHPDWGVELERDGVITVEGSIANPLRAAAQVLTFAPPAATVVVNVRPARAEPATIIRHADTLTVRQTVRSRTQWKTYRLSGLVDALMIATEHDTEQRTRIDRPPWLLPSATAREAFEAAGIPLHEIGTNT